MHIIKVQSTNGGLKQMPDKVEMMSCFGQEGHLGLRLFGGGILMLITFVVIAAVLYFIHKNNGHFAFNSLNRPALHGPNQMSDDELESRMSELKAEYDRRHHVEKLEVELAQLKGEISKLRESKSE